MKLGIVTGGSQGLGAALCNKLVEQGYEVIEFSRTGTASYTVRVDMARPDGAEKVISDTLRGIALRDFGEIVAINNAGVLDPIGPASSKPLHDVVKNLNTNFVSQIVFIRSFVEAFQGHPCRKTLVNISSGAALKGYSGWSLYCASKAGMENFVRSLALEQADAEFPITALNVDPHIMDTEMQAAIRASSAVDFPALPRFLGYKETGRLRPPAEVADAILRIVGQRRTGGERISVATGGIRPTEPGLL